MKFFTIVLGIIGIIFISSVVSAVDLKLFTRSPMGGR